MTNQDEMNIEIVLYHFPIMLDDVYTVFLFFFGSQKFFRSGISQEQSNLSMKTIFSF